MCSKHFPGTGWQWEAEGGSCPEAGSCRGEVVVAVSPQGLALIPSNRCTVAGFDPHRGTDLLE